MKDHKVYSYRDFNYTVHDEASNYNLLKEDNSTSYLAQTNYTLIVNATDNSNYVDETLLNTTFIFVKSPRSQFDHGVLFETQDGEVNYLNCSLGYFETSMSASVCSDPITKDDWTYSLDVFDDARVPVLSVVRPEDYPQPDSDATAPIGFGISRDALNGTVVRDDVFFNKGFPEVTRRLMNFTTPTEGEIEVIDLN